MKIYILCKWNNEGYDFEVAAASSDESLIQELLMDLSFENAYNISMEHIHKEHSLDTGNWLSKYIYKGLLKQPPYFYKKINLIN